MAWIGTLVKSLNYRAYTVYLIYHIIHSRPMFENIMIVIMITIMFDNIIFCAALIFIQKWWWLNIALFSRFFTYYTNFSLCKHAVSPYLYYKSRIIINNVITMSQPLSIIIHFLFLLAWSELLHDGNQTSTLHRASPTTEN